VNGVVEEEASAIDDGELRVCVGEGGKEEEEEEEEEDEGEEEEVGEREEARLRVDVIITSMLSVPQDVNLVHTAFVMLRNASSSSSSSSNSECTHNGSEGGSSSGALNGSCGVMRREELLACLAAALRASDHLLDGLDSTLHPAHRAHASGAPADSMYSCGGPVLRSGGAVLQGEQVVLLFERINARSLSRCILSISNLCLVSVALIQSDIKRSRWCCSGMAGMRSLNKTVTWLACELNKTLIAP